MSRTDSLYAASFRDVGFLVPSLSTDRGQKSVIHEYPNSNRRFVEPLGVFPPIFSLSGIVHGDDYFQQRANLERVLDLPGVGELIHPIYGAVQVRSLPYTVTFNQNRAGEFTFNMKFAISDVEVLPNAEPATKQTASSSADAGRLAANNALGAGYVEPTNGIELASAADSILGAVDSVQDAMDAVIDPLEAGIATFNGTITRIRNRVNRIAQTAAGVQQSVQDMYLAALSIPATVDALSIAWDSLLNFNLGPSGNSSSLGKTNTVQRERNESNKSIIDEHTRVTATIGLFESFANTDFGTSEDLSTSLETAEDAYTRYFQENVSIDGIASLVSDQTLRSAVDQLRVNTRISLDDQLANTWRVTALDFNRSSMALTAYRYYGNLDNVTTLASLNPTVNVANFNRSIDAVTR